MDSKEAKFFQWSKFLPALSYALNGLKIVWKTQQNFRFHTLTAVIVLILSFSLSVNKVEWMLIIMVIAGMFVVEIVNSAIEFTVDLVTEEFHPLAKKAKDLAAAAVLVYAIASVCIGFIIFLPKIGLL